MFVQFDDSRTCEALKLLGALSEEMQVILFTHHDHLVHLARQAIPTEQLSELVLSTFSGASRQVTGEVDAIARPPALVRALEEVPDRRPRMRTADGELERLGGLVLAVLERARRPLGKSEVLAGLEGEGREAGERHWARIVAMLRAQGEVVGTGQKKGFRLRLPTEDERKQGIPDGEVGAVDEDGGTVEAANS